MGGMGGEIKMKIGSMNVRGMNKAHKRNLLFHYFEKNQYDVLCIQETKIRENEIKYIQNKKLGNIFWSSDEKKRKRGVAIYVNRKYETKKLFGDKSGRYIAIEIEHNNEKMQIICIYAPLEKKESFFHELNEEMLKINGHNVILVGDFNGVLVPQRDRESKKKIKKQQGKLPRRCFEMLEEQNMVDVWTQLYGQKKGIYLLF